jgi:phage antirepressor YoqD-like protein
MLTLQAGAEATMSSREIAELTGKEHRNVMADIRAMLEQLEMEPAKFSARYLAGNNQEQPMFVLPKDLTLTLVSGYSVVMRKAIIDRWMDLEADPAPALPRTFAEALRLAADQQDVIVAQAEQLAAAAPAVEFVERYADATGTKGFREVAKLLQANESQFREFLIEERIMYRLAGALTPYGQHIDAGRFCVKTGTAQSNGHAYNAARFTPKGVTWIAGEWAKWQLKQRGEGAHA